MSSPFPILLYIRKQLCYHNLQNRYNTVYWLFPFCGAGRKAGPAASVEKPNNPERTKRQEATFADEILSKRAAFSFAGPPWAGEYHPAGAGSDYRERYSGGAGAGQCDEHYRERFYQR